MQVLLPHKIPSMDFGHKVFPLLRIHSERSVDVLTLSLASSYPSTTWFKISDSLETRIIFFPLLLSRSLIQCWAHFHSIYFVSVTLC